MFVPTIPSISRMTRSHKYSAAGASAAAALVMAVSGLSGAGGTAIASEPTGLTQSASSQQETVTAQADTASELALKDAADREETQQAASRSSERAEAGGTKTPTPQYADNLDGWIKESLAILDKKGIPASYEGIHRNIMRESSGNVRAINNWDINAINGIPSKGLLQVIPPTFQAYHVEGTSHDIYDPVANITAACNYAADRYGTMDNVDSAY